MNGVSHALSAGFQNTVRRRRSAHALDCVDHSADGKPSRVTKLTAGASRISRKRARAHGGLEADSSHCQLLATLRTDLCSSPESRVFVVCRSGSGHLVP